MDHKNVKAAEDTVTPGLQEIRLAKGYTLEQLAVATGLTIEEINSAEENVCVTPAHHLQRISQALRP